MCLLFSRVDIQSFILVLVMDVEKSVDSVQEKNGVVETADKIIQQAEHFGKCGSKQNWA